MRSLLVASLLSLGGLCLIGLVGGDPRGTRDLAASSYITLAGLALSVAVGVAAWRLGTRRALWLVVPSVMLAVIGGLCGWIAGAEFTGQPDSAARLAATPGRVAFMLAMTAAGMALPSVGLAALTRRGKART
jgi:hypothetical protein